VHLGRVTGTVWATQKVETLRGYRLLVVQPLTHDLKEKGQLMVAVDTVSAAPGQIVYVVKSREASKALEERFNPVDVAIVGIVDQIRTSDGVWPEEAGVWPEEDGRRVRSRRPPGGAEAEDGS
jgi:ethanolamine utilization protein EutN